MRVDVPDTTGSKAFTKLFGQGAIFSITPIEEDVARALASRYEQKPVHVYELPVDFRNSPRMIEQGDSDSDFFDEE